MTVLVNYDNHPAYRSLQNSRLEKLVEEKFFPKFRQIQNVFFEVLEASGSRLFERYATDQSIRNDLKLFEIPIIRQKQILSIFNEFINLDNWGDEKCVIWSSGSLSNTNKFVYQALNYEVRAVVEDLGIIEFLREKTGVCWKIQSMEALSGVGENVSNADDISRNKSNAKGTQDTLKFGHLMFENKLRICVDQIEKNFEHSLLYVNGSEKWFSQLDRIIRRATYHSGIGSTSELSARLLFYNLPHFFRRKCNVGDDLTEEQLNALSYSVKDLEKKDLMVAALFDCDGFFAQKSNRKAIDVSLRPEFALKHLTETGF